MTDEKIVTTIPEGDLPELPEFIYSEIMASSPRGRVVPLDIIFGHVSDLGYTNLNEADRTAVIAALGNSTYFERVNGSGIQIGAEGWRAHRQAQVSNGRYSV